MLLGYVAFLDQKCSVRPGGGSLKLVEMSGVCYYLLFRIFFFFAYFDGPGNV